MVLTSERGTVVRTRTGVSLIELCEAGRYRQAAALAEKLESDGAETALALGMIEIAHGELGLAKDRLSPLAFSASPLADRAKVHLAVAYWYGGEAREAKDLLRDIPDSFEKYLLRAIIEDRPKLALRLLNKASKYDVRPAMSGRLHNQRALILRKLRHLDRAVQEYEAALYFFEQDQSDCIALVINNLAGVYLDFEQRDRALEYAERAIKMLKDDPAHLGKALDQKSQILLKKGEFDSASQTSFEAVGSLRKSDRKAWLIEALLTRARILRALEDSREAGVLEEAEAVCRYLNREDLLIDVLRERTLFAENLYLSTERRLLQTALHFCGGHFRTVATRLRTNHPRVMRLLKKHGLNKQS